jgi:hypothetical protein
VIDGLVSRILNEAVWLPVSMTLALVATLTLLYRHRRADLSARQRVTAAMNAFFGITIATMALGHFSAVTTKLALGALERAASVVYGVGILFALPACLLTRHARQLLLFTRNQRGTTIVLNAWLALTLLALGRQNLPLTAPALLNIGYQLHSRRLAGRVIVTIAVLVNVALFIVALMFLASGQSFEEFMRSGSQGA